MFDSIVKKTFLWALIPMFPVTIGVNRPAIVREIPHVGLFPAFPHFCENVPHFWLYFETTKIAQNRNIFLAVRKHFVRKVLRKRQ